MAPRVTLGPTITTYIMYLTLIAGERIIPVGSKACRVFGVSSTLIRCPCTAAISTGFHDGPTTLKDHFCATPVNRDKYEYLSNTTMPALST